MERKPIKVYRKPIILTQMEKIQIKLREIQDSTREQDIISISEHYNMLARNVRGITGYNSLSTKDPMSHKNWIHFESVYEICRMKEWDSKLYLEAQFTRFKGWQQKMPFPNMLYSTKGLIYFTNYLADKKAKHKYDVDRPKKEEGKTTKPMKIIVIEDIVSSVSLLNILLEKTKHENTEQYKVLKLYHSWQEFSPYYLWSIPWFHQVLEGTEGIKADQYKAEFNRISNSPMMQEVIRYTVQEVENQYKIPPNIQL